MEFSFYSFHLFVKSLMIFSECKQTTHVESWTYSVDVSVCVSVVCPPLGWTRRSENGKSDRTWRELMDWRCMGRVGDDVKDRDIRWLNETCPWILTEKCNFWVR